MHIIDEKLVTIGLVQTFPSIITTDDKEKPVPMIFTAYPPPYKKKRIDESKMNSFVLPAPPCVGEIDEI